VGLAPALNRGADAAAGEFLLFLNNDMRFHKEFVASMVSQMLDSDDVFAVDALQYDWDGENEVHLATRLDAKGCEGNRCHELTPGLYMCQAHQDTPTPVLMASAANMLARRAMFQALGGFDEKLFFGYEDVDLCWRGWIRGWNTVFVPGAKCWHRVSHSGQSNSAKSLSFRGVVTGRLVMAIKLLPAKYATITWLMSLAGLAGDLALLRWRRTGDRIHVFNECLRHLPSLIRERRQIHGSARTTPSAQLERMFQLGSSGSLGRLRRSSAPVTEDVRSQ
jgi:GT2 family glycosyltransferase